MTGVQTPPAPRECEQVGAAYRIVSDGPVRLPYRSPLQIREYQQIVDRIARDAPGSLLDWGCGYGRISVMLGQAGLDVTSFEYMREVPPTDHLGFNRFYPGLEVWTNAMTGDEVALPFADDSFDAILSLGVLEHVQYPERSLDELARILRPGGTLYVYKLPNTRSYVERLAKWSGGTYHGDGRWPDTLYTLDSAIELLTRHGYRVSEARYYNMLPLDQLGRVVGARTGRLWRLNDRLSEVPLVNRLATNVEVIATL